MVEGWILLILQSLHISIIKNHQTLQRISSVRHIAYRVRVGEEAGSGVLMSHKLDLCFCIESTQSLCWTFILVRWCGELAAGFLSTMLSHSDKLQTDHGVRTKNEQRLLLLILCNAKKREHMVCPPKDGQITVVVICVTERCSYISGEVHFRPQQRLC